MTLGQRIQQIRDTANLSQEAFGEKLGTTRQTVSKWELDQTVPEIGKIVLISRLFSVTTDSILIDGITTFDDLWTSLSSGDRFSCGVYKSENCEVVETERFSLVYYSSSDGMVLGTRLYVGMDAHKKLFAICEYNRASGKIGYAYKTEKVFHMMNADNSGLKNKPSSVISANDDGLKNKLGCNYDNEMIKSMRRTEVFAVKHDVVLMPTVKEAGIKNCLMAWRMADYLAATACRFSFWLCTGKTEYIFSIEPQDENIYCGITYTFPFDLGMLGGRQFFRIRNYQDNSQPWCRFFSDLGYECNEMAEIPMGKCELGKCVNTDHGMVWGLKRYTDDQIVLQGCGEDEYIFGREDKRTEVFTY